MFNYRTVLLMLSFACSSTVLLTAFGGRQTTREDIMKEEDRKFNEKHCAQLEQLRTVINSGNVDTPLNRIPGVILGNQEHTYPLEYAVFISHLLTTLPISFDETINHLLAAGANPNKYLVHHPLRYATIANNYNLVKQLIDHGADIPQDILDDINPMILINKPEIIDLLVQHGAAFDVNRCRDRIPLFMILSPAKLLEKDFKE